MKNKWTRKYDANLRRLREERRKEIPAEQERSRLLGKVFGKCHHGAPHEWFVFSTAIVDVVLMVECRVCRANGIVRNPSLEEWREATDLGDIHAPKNPYPWEQPERVEILSGGAVEPGKSVSMRSRELIEKWRECLGETWDETEV
jgi:hypothetical protein